MFTAIAFLALLADDADTTKSVLVNPPAASAQETAPETDVATSGEEFICVDGKCRRVVGVASEQITTQRRRPFGRYVIRNTDRTVYRTRR